MELIVKFPDQSESFTYSVEYGRLLEKIERGDQFINNNKFPVRIENKSLLEETCIKYNYVPIWGKVYFGEWIEFIGIKQANQN